MSSFGPDMPVPVPDIDDAPFWRAAAEQRLVFQRCAACGRHRHPPSPMCPVCQSAMCDWSAAPARATLFSFTVTHVAPHPALRGRTPYVVGLVSFPTLDDVRLVTNIINCEPARLTIGAEVEVVWDPCGEDLYLPRYSLVSQAARDTEASQ